MNEKKIQQLLCIVCDAITVLFCISVVLTLLLLGDQVCNQLN